MDNNENGVHILDISRKPSTRSFHKVLLKIQLTHKK